MASNDYYKALGVPETATLDEIKKAYREIAKKYHPDRNPGDAAAEEKFKAATEAYDTLSDTGKRTKYDQLRRFGGAGRFTGGSYGGGTEEMTYEEFMRKFGTSAQRERYGSGKTTGRSGGGFSINEMFENLFGGKRDTREAVASDEPQPTDDPFFKRKGNDAYVELTVNLAQAVLGSKVRVRTPSGKKVTVTISPGTDPEKLLRVPKMGYAAGSPEGDLYIRIHVSIPKDLTDEQRELMEQFAAALGLRH